MRFNFNIDDMDLIDNDVALSKTSMSQIYKKENALLNNAAASIEAVMLKELCLYKFYTDEKTFNTYPYEIVKDNKTNFEVYKFDTTAGWNELFGYLDNYLKCKNWLSLSFNELNNIKNNKEETTYHDFVYKYVYSLEDNLSDILGLHISDSYGLSCIMFKDQRIEFRLTGCKEYKDCLKNPSDIELSNNQQKICKLLGTGQFFEPYKDGFIIWWCSNTTSIPQIVKELLGKYSSHKNTIAIQTFHQTCLYHFKPNKEYTKTRLVPDGVLIKRYRAINKNDYNPIDKVDFELNQSRGQYNIIEFQYMSYDEATDVCNNMR